MRALVLLLALLPSIALGQTAVRVIAGDTVQSGCLLNAANTVCAVEMRGKTSVGFVVTAVSSPSGISLVAESSRDATSGSTGNWDGHKFIDADNGNTLTTVPNASLAVGYTRGFIVGMGVRWARIRASAWTSGSATVQVVASDTTTPATIPIVEVNDGSAQPTAQTTGEFRAPVASTDGRTYVSLGGPVAWTCSLNAIAATLTECRAAPAAGLSLYVSWVWWQSTTTTAGTGALQSGTGTNCGTATTAVLPKSGTANRYGYPASSTASSTLWFPVPIKLTAAHALCAIGVATNTLRIDVGGFTAP